MSYLDLLAFRHVLGKLVQVGSPGKVQDNLVRNLGEALVKLMHVVWLHGLEIEDFMTTIGRACRSEVRVRSTEKSGTLAAPGRTSEDHEVFVEAEALLDDLKAVSLDEEDLAGDAVHLGVVLGALENVGILLDGEDHIPPTGLSERDGIATGASKGVDDGGLASRHSIGNLLCDLAALSLEEFRAMAPHGEMTYSATGSGVTPNHALSVIQTPSS